MSRGDRITPFHAMAAMKVANEREAAGHPVLHMELGEPTGGAPAAVLAAAAEMLRSRAAELRYTEALGLPVLRRRIAERIREAYGVDVDPDRVAVTTGGVPTGAVGRVRGRRPHRRDRARLSGDAEHCRGPGHGGGRHPDPRA